MRREAVNPDYLIPFEPIDIPGLVAFWQFQEPSDHFVALQGEPYVLRSQLGCLDVTEDTKAPLGPRVLDIKEGQWLSIPRYDCPKLDFPGKDGQLTVIAWLKRQPTATNHCEFIA